MKTPKLDIYYIELNKMKNNKNEVDKTLRALKWCGKMPVSLQVPKLIGAVFLASSLLPVSYFELYSIIGNTAKQFKSSIDEKRFFVINSMEELEKYENAHGFEWQYNEKKLQKRQYYIRHPLSQKRNLLIESENFYDYIDEEQKNELIQYIMAYCPVKKICIEREELNSLSVNSKGKTKGLDLDAGGGAEKFTGKYFGATYPNGTVKEEPRVCYNWIDSSLLTSIKHMTEGAVLTQKYELDFRFGLDVSEAKTLGLDMNRYKKFIYTVHIEC